MQAHVEPELEPTPRSTYPPSTRPQRPVATDYFDDIGSRPTGAAEGPTTEGSSWRRQPSFVDTPQPQPTPSTEQVAPVQPSESNKPDLQINPPPPHAHIPSHRRMSTASEDQQRGHGVHPRSPLTPSYREAPMSALDDTMARIRGAMTGLQQKAEAAALTQVPPHAHTQAPAPPPVPAPASIAAPAQPRPKWLPPALRPRSATLHDDAPIEVFDVTAAEPPRSPKPAWNHFPFKLPKVSIPIEPLSKRQLHIAKTIPHVRTDMIFSWEPPIDGMNRRDFSLNDILFLKPYVGKGGRVKYHVSLPRNRSFRPGKPVVNLPLRPAGSTPAGVAAGPAPMVNGGAFGKRREADEASSWRKPNAPKPQAGEPHQGLGLDTTSRSPPPESSNDIGGAGHETSTDEATSPTVSVAPAKLSLRSQPKMPQGSDVAFYRDSRSDSVSQPGASVKFIVNSELEDGGPSPIVNGFESHSETRINGDVGSLLMSRVVVSESGAVSKHEPAERGLTEIRKTESSVRVSHLSTWEALLIACHFRLRRRPSTPTR